MSDKKDKLWFRVFGKLNRMNLLHWLPDRIFLKIYYFGALGKKLDLISPKTFNEKLQWQKLYDHDDRYTRMVDKIAAKEYVDEILGEGYTVPNILVADNPDDIDFSSLPNRFVIKCNHNSGNGMVICDDKSKLNTAIIKKNLREALKENYYYYHREWAYKNVPPKILIEDYISADENSSIDGLVDYKFYCFNGEPKFLYLGFANIINGQKHDLLSFFNLDWTPAPFYRNDHEPFPYNMSKPKDFDKMIAVARKLSEGIKFVRVDLYYTNGRILFSEFTFCPGGGYGVFYPLEYETELGSWIKTE